MNIFYLRISERVFFLLPAVAVGVDVDGAYFFEVAWFNYAIGISPNFEND